MIATADATLGAVIVAAGSGQRFGHTDKVLRPLAGRPVLGHSLDLFLSLSEVKRVVVVLGAHTIVEGTKLLKDRQSDRVAACLGGGARSESVRAGLEALPPEVDLVAVHDAGRPLAGSDLLRRVVDAARVHGAAAPVVPVSDTLARLGPNLHMESIEPREMLGAVQTPQVARRDWLEVALRAVADASDESGALLAAGYPVVTVDGCAENIKLTWPADLAIAEAILQWRRQ